MRDSTGQLLDEIGRYKLLTPDEEISLSRQVQAWLAVRHSEEPKHRKIVRQGKRAFERMSAANLRLVVHIAQRHVYRCKTLELTDLVQYGTIGLVRAVELFDATKGYKFSTYAYWWIRQAIGRAIEDYDRLIRIPVHQNEKLATIARIRRELGRKATPDVIKERLGLSQSQYETLINAPTTVASLDVQQDDKSPILDLIPDTRCAPEYETTQLQAIRDLVETLPDPKYRDIIKRRYGFNGGRYDSLQSIADDYGVTRERIRQIQVKAETQLRLKARQRGVA